MHPQVRWVLCCQLMVTVAAGLLAGVAMGFDAAVSALLGGGIATASSYVYAWRAFRSSAQADCDARKAFRGQVAGEGYKFAVSLLLFTAVFKGYAQLAALPLFLAYAATVVVYWMALLRQQ